jgi:hypothetical protein
MKIINGNTYVLIRKYHGKKGYLIKEYLKVKSDPENDKSKCPKQF